GVSGPMRVRRRRAPGGRSYLSWPEVPSASSLSSELASVVSLAGSVVVTGGASGGAALGAGAAPAFGAGAVVGDGAGVGVGAGAGWGVPKPSGRSDSWATTGKASAAAIALPERPSVTASSRLFIGPGFHSAWLRQSRRSHPPQSSSARSAGPGTAAIARRQRAARPARP